MISPRLKGLHRKFPLPVFAAMLLPQSNEFQLLFAWTTLNELLKEFLPFATILLRQ